MATLCKRLLRSAYLEHVIRYGSQYQGNIGAQTAKDVATTLFDLRSTFQLDRRSTTFKPAYHGCDGVFMDNSGNLVVVEAKAETTDQRPSLGQTKFREQMSSRWVARKAFLMQRPESAQYSEENARIGAKIEKIGPENVRRIIVNTNPETGQVQAWEGQRDGSWKPIRF